MADKDSAEKTGSLKAFAVWFVITFVIGAFGFGQRISEPPTLIGAAVVAGLLSWFMAYKVMPTSATPRPRASRDEGGSSNQLKLILLLSGVLLVVAIVIAVVQSI